VLSMPQLWDATRDFHFVTPIGDAKWVGQSCPRLKIHTFSGTYESVEAALRGSHSRLYSLQQHAWLSSSPSFFLMAAHYFQPLRTWIRSNTTGNEADFFSLCMVQQFYDS